MQRLRVTYRKHGPARFVAHLDLMRTWERAIRRARLPLAYSQGFSPHPRLQLAAPLPVGTAGERELLDLWLERPSPAQEVVTRLGAALPPGIEVVAAEEVPERTPALQAATVGARYEARFDAEVLPLERLRPAVERLMAVESLPWEEERGERTRRYDLRAALLSLEAREVRGTTLLAMHVAMREGASLRPSSILAALGLADVEPELVTRTEIEVASEPVLAPAGAEAAAGDEGTDE